MGLLHKIGIVVGVNNIASSIFEELFPDFLKVKYDQPSEYIKKYWGKYEIYAKKEKLEDNNVTNGKIFEYLLATLFIREDILPFYLEAKVAFVPNVKFDLMLYAEECGPICISAKMSLRERYKQADLEAIALKYVHRKSKIFLITLNEKEAEGIKKKIKTGDVIGLDDVIYAKSARFDELIKELKTNYKFSQAGKIQIIEASQIVTRESLKGLVKALKSVD
ncbi:hypothetical protein HZA43_02615 [Candidatus Peregrinibacteria bacterium]|nr:hypothetical protein [Candidatus Peregrinibacteria bacterium]